MEIEKYAKIVFWWIFRYFVLTYEIILSPREAISFLWEKRHEKTINPYTFFFFNIILIQLLSLVTAKVSSLEGVGNSDAVFLLPVLGNVNVSYIANFISYYSGACIIGLILMYVMFNGKVLGEKIIFVIMYSSILLLVWDVLISVVILSLMYGLWEFFGANQSLFDYEVNISALRIVNDIEFIRMFFTRFFTLGLLAEIIGIIFYFGYIYNMIQRIVPEFKLQIKRSICCALIYIFTVLTPYYIKCEIFDAAFSDIEQRVERIKTSQKAMFSIKSVEETFVLPKNLFELLDIKNEYLSLSRNSILSETDRYELFRTFVLLNNKDIISKNLNRSYELVLMDIFYDEYASTEYLTYLVTNNIDVNNIKRLSELENKSRLEKQIFGNKSSINIMIEKHMHRQRQYMAQFVVPMSLFRLYP